MHQIVAVKTQNSGLKVFLLLIVILSLAVGALLSYIFILDKKIDIHPILPTPATIQKNLEPSEELYAVNFFASWCKACMAEHKNLIKLHHKTGVPLYGVAVNDLAENIQLMMSKYSNPYKKISLNFPIMELTEIRIERIPRFLIIYKGNIVYDHTGEVNDRILAKKIMPVFEKIRQLKYSTAKE